MSFFYKWANFRTKSLKATNITISGLTATRVVFSGTGGLLTDDSGFTFNTTGDILTVGAINVAGSTAPTSGWYLPSADLIRTPNSVTVDNDLNVTEQVGIGTTAATNTSLLVGVLGSAPLVTADQLGIRIDQTFSTAATSSVCGLQTDINLTDGAYTITNVFYQRHFALVGGAGTTVTTETGIQLEALSKGSTIYAIRSLTAAAANRYNLGITGTAMNLLAGNTRIGGATDPTVALDVTGAALISTTLGVTGNTTLTGDLAVNGGDLTSSATTFNLLNATVTTLNLGSAVATGRIGAATSNWGWGAAAVGYVGILQRNGFTSDGGSTYVAGYQCDPILVGASGDTLLQAKLVVGGNNGITTQASDTVGVVAAAYLFEPNITVGGSGAVTTAATLYIASAPTEGATNDALHVAAGTSRFLGNVITNTILSVNTTATVFNTVATTVNAFGAATTLAIGAATGTLTVSNTTLAAKAGTFSTTLGVTGITTLGAPVTLKGYTVATLPAGVQGHTAFVTDALAPAFLTAVVGGGAIVAPVFYDGANWVAI